MVINTKLGFFPRGEGELDPTSCPMSPGTFLNLQLFLKVAMLCDLKWEGACLSLSIPFYVLPVCLLAICWSEVPRKSCKSVPSKPLLFLQMFRLRAVWWSSGPVCTCLLLFSAHCLNLHALFSLTGDNYPVQFIPSTMAAAAAASGLSPLQLQVCARTKICGLEANALVENC